METVISTRPMIFVHGSRATLRHRSLTASLSLFLSPLPPNQKLLIKITSSSISYTVKYPPAGLLLPSFKSR
jgi:hypothetical protein